jgi:hypothetical protein
VPAHVVVPNNLDKMKKMLDFAGWNEGTGFHFGMVQYSKN